MITEIRTIRPRRGKEWESLPWYSEKSSRCKVCGMHIFKLKVNLEGFGIREYWHENEKHDLKHAAEPR